MQQAGGRGLNHSGLLSGTNPQLLRIHYLSNCKLESKACSKQKHDKGCKNLSNFIFDVVVEVEQPNSTLHKSLLWPTHIAFFDPSIHPLQMQAVPPAKKRCNRSQRRLRRRARQKLKPRHHPRRASGYGPWFLDYSFWTTIMEWKWKMVIGGVHFLLLWLWEER